MAIVKTPNLGLPYSTNPATDDTYDVIGGLFVKDGDKKTLPEIVDDLSTRGNGSAEKNQKITIPLTSWAETKSVGVSTWIAEPVEIDGITPSSVIRLSALAEETAKDMAAGQVGAEVVSSADGYHVRVGIINWKPTIEWTLLAQVVEVDGHKSPSVILAPPIMDAGVKIGQHNQDEAAHPYIRSLVDAVAKELFEALAKIYTRDEVNSLVSSIPKFAIEVVSSLPTDKINETTVYLVAGGDDDTNLYTEYINVKGVWERLGTQTVDLTGYVTQTALNDTLAYYVKTVDMEAYFSAAINAALAAYLTTAKAAELYQPKGNYLTEHQSLDHLVKIYQGTAYAGMILVVGEDGYLTLADMPSGGADITVRVDEIDGKPVIVLEGNVPVGSYEAYYTMQDGTLVKIGDLTLSEDTPLETYTVTFVADGVTVAVIEYTEGDTTLSSIPDVPAKDGYTGVWEPYDISKGGNITVNAIYTEIPANSYTVTKRPTNCTINGADSVTEGEAYTATVTADEGYNLSSVVVTMGETDITESAYDNAGNINIASVTGHIVIAATATKIITNWLPISTDEEGNTIGVLANRRLSTSTGNVSEKTGVNASGFIGVFYGDTVLIRNAEGIINGTDPHLCFYGGDKKAISGVTGVVMGNKFTETDELGGGYVATLDSKFYDRLSDSIGLTYIRLSCSLLTADTIINIKRDGEWL